MKLLSEEELNNLAATYKEPADRSWGYELEIAKAQASITRKETASEIFERIEKLRESCCIGKETSLCPLATPVCGFLSRSCRLYQNLKKKYGL